MKKNILSLKKTTVKEVQRNWGTTLPASFHIERIYIRCNKKGEINWDKAPIYTESEIKGRPIRLL